MSRTRPFGLGSLALCTLLLAGAVALGYLALVCPPIAIPATVGALSCLACVAWEVRP